MLCWSFTAVDQLSTMEHKSKPLVAVLVCFFALNTVSVFSEDAEQMNPIEEYLSRFPENGSVLDKWEPPKNLTKNYIYYLSGHDDENSPVWVSEWGKWDLKSIFEGNDEEMKANYDKYVDQMGVRFFRSILEASTPEEPVTDIVWIIDMDAYALDQASSVASVRYNLNKLKDLLPIGRAVKTVFVINSNFLVDGMIRLMRPLVGKLLDNVQVYGTNKNTYIPRILRSVPRSQLPQWYGGTNKYKPLKVYG